MKTEQLASIDPRALEDIKDLREKINDFSTGKIPEDRFKAFRLTRGVYGQRQPGVQMFRIKFQEALSMPGNWYALPTCQTIIPTAIYISPPGRIFNCITFIWRIHPTFGRPWKR